MEMEFSGIWIDAFVWFALWLDENSQLQKCKRKSCMFLTDPMCSLLPCAQVTRYIQLQYNPGLNKHISTNHLQETADYNITVELIITAE